MPRSRYFSPNGLDSQKDSISRRNYRRTQVRRAKRLAMRAGSDEYPNHYWDPEREHKTCDSDVPVKGCYVYVNPKSGTESTFVDPA